LSGERYSENGRNFVLHSEAPGKTEEFIINADDFRLVEIQVVRSDARAKERYSYQLDIENSRVPLDSEFVLADQVD
jgi:hypothetical protein